MLVSADKIIDNVSAGKLKLCVTIEGNSRGNGYILFYTHTHTHTHPFNGPLSGTTRVSRYQKRKT